MKHLQRFTWLISLLVAANSLMLSPAHAQDAAEQNESDSLTIKGEFSLRGFYDFKPYGAEDFSLANIPVGKDKNKKCANGIDLAGAKLGLSKKFPWGDKAIEFVVRSGLSPEGAKLKAIYIDYDKFRVGRAISNFCDLSALPETLFDPPCSTALASAAQVRWKDQLQGLSYALAMEKAVELDIYPAVKKEDKGKQKLVPLNNFPALSAMIKYEESIGYLRLGGLFRMLDYYAKSEDKTRYLPTWGFNLTSSLKVIPDQTTVKLYGVYGMGMGSYLIGLASSAKACKDVFLQRNTTPTLINTLGGYIGLEHRWLPQLRSTAVYGILDTINKKQSDDNAYKQGHFVACNLTYHPTENLSLGLEYLFGRRFTIGDQNGRDAHRIQTAFGFSF